MNMEHWLKDNIETNLSTCRKTVSKEGTDNVFLIKYNGLI